MRTLIIILTGFVLIVSAACNKQVRIEKNLWKGGGEWKIERFEAQNISTYTPYNSNVSESNYGTFIFNEDGSGKYIFTANGNYESGKMLYSNSEDELLMHLDVSYVYKMTWQKNSIQITREDEYTDNFGSGFYTETYWLKKK